MTREAVLAELEIRVRTVLGTRVGPELARDLPADARFDEIGIDSLDIVLVLAELEQRDAANALTGKDLREAADCIDSLVRHLAERHG
ncbi:phosphopantetheine-binding protein [Streptomyces longwoodensis]|jgi:hypothetical protein|uniref:phosphopantetheine-binding protein n=1 Tax=Streptomyces longwoodensis TaxID=68231 RepID=UPI00379FBB0B